MRRIFPLFLLLFAASFAACTSSPVPVRVLESWQPQEDALTTQDAVRDWRFSGEQGDAATYGGSGECRRARQGDDAPRGEL